MDNDCDGKTDEDLKQNCDANGQLGEQLCTNGAWAACTPTCKPTAEVCDGKDNNCDGKVDQDDKGAALTQVCDAGNNTVGTQTCTNGAWSTCVGNCTPAVEDCDGKDNDCDGKIDEGADGTPLKKSCNNACGQGTQVCAGGAWEACTAPQPKTEECNGVDDDCDGKVDEDFECAKGATTSCGVDTGECSLGTKVCDSTCKWGQCLGNVAPTTEKCDGKDWDCDGTPDTGCGCTAGQTKDCCGGTKISCTGGTWPICPATPLETCDGIDNDCNGKIDDGLAADPYLLEENVLNKDDCASAPQLKPDLEENGGAMEFQGYLYKADLKADKDFFFIQTTEVDDLSCVWNSDYNECYTLTVTLTEPTGQDYEICLYNVGEPGDPYTCAAPKIDKICSNVGGQAKNKIVYNLSGGCGIEDGLGYYIEVSPASSSVVDSCKPYKINVELVGSGPQAAACTFPF